MREGARERIAEIADRLGLTADQLADRLLPDLGLDADGTTTLDYGPRSFVVGFDEQLRPIVTDDTGARRKDLPKPGSTDDPDVAPASLTRFRKLKKDAKAAAADQIRRLERAMTDGRRFTLEELTTVLIDHPLRFHIVRRVLWATYVDDTLDASCTGTFRVAEDRTFADVDDHEMTLDPDAVIGVAHPLHLGVATSTWSGRFADYELLQPFDQIARSTFAVGDGLLTGSTVDHVIDATAESVRFHAIAGRGWRRPEVADGGMTWQFSRPLGHDAELVIDTDPGVYAGDYAAYPEQRIADARLVHALTGAPLTFAEIGRVAMSEALRELNWLTSPGIR